MSTKTDIEWTATYHPDGTVTKGSTWNPVRGCSKCSDGCKFCYAETFSERWRGIKDHPFEHGFDLRLVPEKLDDPLKWKKGRKIFVNSMSDLFHEDIPVEYIVQVFDVMLRAPQHTYQVLTKRYKRMRDLMQGPLNEYAKYPHIWLGVSAENEKYGLPRIRALLQTPARVRFVSAEPLLDWMDLGQPIWPDEIVGGSCLHGAPMRDETWSKLNLIIVGCESGHGRRPMDIEWARSLRKQCVDADIPFFMKQMEVNGRVSHDIESFPPDLRIREFPVI